MKQTICALCGLNEIGFDYKGKIGKIERINHLVHRHGIVNIPSQQWMADSKKIFVLLPERDIDEQALEFEQIEQLARELMEPDN